MDEPRTHAVSEGDPAARAAALVAWLVPALLIVLLSLRNGGYDTIVRGEVGMVVWWALLVAVLVGAVGVPSIPRNAKVLGALLGGLVLWTALSLAWSESDERSAIELARVLTYLGVLGLAVVLAAAGRGRQLLNGATAGVAIVVGLALLSRLEPSWFPEQDVGSFIPDIELERRLAYPLNYSSGLAVMAGLALPLLLRAAASGITALGRGLAVAMLPIACLVLWLTGSSLALPLGLIAVAAFLVLTDERLKTLGALAIGLAGGGALILAASGREALDRGLESAEALREGDEMLVISLIVCAVAVLAQLALARAVRGRTAPAPPRISRRALGWAAAAVVLVGAVGAVAAGVPGELSDRWDSFTAAEGLDPNDASRGEQVLDVSARGRYQYWQSSIDAFETEPLLGIGPGTFEFWWARGGDADAAIFVRNAHSLYLETLAELGLVGFLLVLAFTAFALVTGALRAWRAAPGVRPEVAAAAAGCFVFAAAALVDWVWELAALPVVFMALVAVASVPARTEGALAPEPAATRGPGWLSRLGGVGLCLLALVGISLPLASAASVEQSREHAAEGDYESALADARDAIDAEPYAATPRIQEAVVLERLGRFGEAVAAAREATEREPTNWRMWLVLSRLEARNGDAEAAVEAFREAKSLFPRGFNQFV